MNKIKIYLSVLFAVFYLSANSQNFFWSHSKPVFKIKYGLLYNWYAASDARNITSSDDWVVPTNTNYNTLIAYVGGFLIAGGELKETGFIYWSSPNTGATNNYNFNLRGSGLRSPSTGLFSLKNQQHWSWTVSNWTTDSKIAFRAFYNNTEANAGNGNNIKYGHAIRLLYVGAGTPTSYTGNDGKVYRVVAIGTSPVQYWLADSLCETKFRNGDVIPWYGANPANFFTDAEWAALTTAGVCAYDNNLSNVANVFSFP